MKEYEREHMCMCVYMHTSIWIALLYNRKPMSQYNMLNGIYFNKTKFEKTHIMKKVLPKQAGQKAPPLSTYITHPEDVLSSCSHVQTPHNPSEAQEERYLYGQGF